MHFLHKKAKTVWAELSIEEMLDRSYWEKLTKNSG
jgi:hypothetical protein